MYYEDKDSLELQQWEWGCCICSKETVMKNSNSYQQDKKFSHFYGIWMVFGLHLESDQSDPQYNKYHTTFPSVPCFAYTHVQIIQVWHSGIWYIPIFLASCLTSHVVKPLWLISVMFLIQELNIYIIYRCGRGRFGFIGWIKPKIWSSTFELSNSQIVSSQWFRNCCCWTQSESHIWLWSE